MSKKILSVVLALVFVMSTFVTVAFAAANYEELDNNGLSEYKQVWSLGEAVASADGKTYTVDVKLKTNYPTGSISFKLVETDANGVIELQGVTLGSGIPAAYNAEAKLTDSKTKVIIYPEATMGYSAPAAVAIDGVVATLTYSYTGSGKATVAIANDPKTADNAGGTLIAARMGNKTIASTDNITGQTVVDANGVAITDAVLSPIEIGSAAVAPTLAVKAGTNGVINTERTVVDSYNDVECTGYIYGVEPGKALNTVFEVVGDGTMEVVASGSKECATGTTLNVLDLEGNVVETYMFILFGDVTGDGVINTIDAGDIELHDAGMWGYNLETEENVYEDLGYDGNFPEYKIFAGNVDGNTATNTIDAGNIALHDAGMWGYNLETEENIYEDLGLDGCFTQEYIISKLN